MRHIYKRSIAQMMEIFDLGPTVALSVLLLTFGMLVIGVIFFVRSAPPSKLTISSGPEGSIFHGMAQKYQKELAKNGITVEILTSNGSLDNLRKLRDRKGHVDLAFIQNGSEDGLKSKRLVSLGSLSYQPLFFFYTGATIERIADMKGKTIAIGHEGSGGRRLALKILKLNGMEQEEKLITLDGESIVDALLKKKIDGAFLMGEDASLKVLQKLLFEEHIHLLSFKNAEAYVRKIDTLHVVELPEGVLDFAKNIPHKKILLVGPTVELIATKALHPALSDIILDAAQEIHGPAGIFKKRNEFPRSVESNIKISEDAERFYRSGKSFLYRYLPFWLASLLNRIFISFVPVLVILIPAVRSIPALFKWLGQLRIRRRYRALLRLEARFKNEKDPEKLRHLNDQFEAIERDVELMKVRPLIADQFYELRAHIDYVRRVMAARRSASGN